jgi:predicted nicotinamide N-methyase
VQTWGSSILFARRIAQTPSAWGILTTDASSSASSVRPQRILELGAGTGVLSLAMASLPNLPQSTLIVATDYNTIVLENLRKNVGLNFGSPSAEEGTRNGERGVLVHPLDWLAFHETGDGVDVRTVGRDGIRHKEDLALNGTTKQDIIARPPFNERFDLIFGADIVYEAHQAPWIHSTVSHFLAYPDADSPVEPSFHLFVPLRPTHQAEIVALEATFPLASELALRVAEEDWRLATLEVESLVRTEGVGRADETCYRRYRIGWA